MAHQAVLWIEWGNSTTGRIPPIGSVILSAGTASRSEAVPKSKDPCTADAPCAASGNSPRALAVALLTGSQFQSAEMFPQGVAHQSGPISLSALRGLVGGFAISGISKSDQTESCACI